MIIYEPGKEMDLVLAHLWVRMGVVGDLGRLLGGKVQPLSSFLRDAQPPGVVFLEVDQEGAWFYLNLTPFYAGAWVACWLDPRKRQSKEGLRAVREGHELALSSFPLLLAATPHEEILGEMARFGWELQGKIPGLYEEGGPPAHLLSLSRTALL